MTSILLTDAATELQASEFDSVHSCLILAPHPDDESLGCGGLIALLRKTGKDVFVVFTTDGSLSHPSSKKYPAEALATLRREEAISALSVLGVPEDAVFFFAKKDGSLPAAGEEKFEQNANQLHLLITLLQPDLVLVPYENDPHRDHRATWQMLAHAHNNINAEYRTLEYMVWLMVRGEDNDMPAANTLRYLDIADYKGQKMEAVRKHISQTTRLIDDDPKGFVISDDMLRLFDTDKEYYIDRNL